MLSELHIRNFAIIDDLHLRFGPGLNVLTGETGAGKSIIIDALGLLLGDRATAEWIRAGTDRAEIEATFQISANLSSVDSSQNGYFSPEPMHPGEFQTLQKILTEQALDDPANPDWLLLSREVRNNGRNVCRVNGRVVSLQILSDIASFMIDVHGQGEHLNLLQAKTHIHLLDRYADLLITRQIVTKLVRELRQVRTELDHLQQDARSIAQRLDMLSYQTEEIFEAALQPDEDIELENERRRLGNAETLLILAQSVQAVLHEGGADGTPSAVDLVGEATGSLERLARIDPEMQATADEAQSLLEQLSDLSRTLADYADGLEFNPDRLQEVEERLELIHNLKRKYGDTIEQIQAFGQEAQAELDEMSNWEVKTAELEEREDELLREIGQMAEKLSKKRGHAGKKMARQVEAELADLKMDRARFGVEIDYVERQDGAYLSDGRRVAFDETGIDRLEFMMSANPGEPLKPMAKVASGGETARLMLALKSVLAHADATPTLIFDEIDQGIGGRVGAIVGQKLWALTKHLPETSTKKKKKTKGRNTKQNPADKNRPMHQVLCITHLPQLAAFGDVHFTVNKKVQQENGTERTSTVVSHLHDDHRIGELMQMLGATSDAGRRSVGEMLSEVRKTKEEG